MNRSYFLILFSLLVFIGSPIKASAIQDEALTINGSSGAEGFDSMPNGSAGKIPGKMMINIRTSCFGTNLRSVSNPISPDSEITAVLKIRAGLTEIPIYIKFPGDLVEPKSGIKANTFTTVTESLFPASGTDPRSGYPSITRPSNAKAIIYGNMIQITMDKPSALMTATQGSASLDDYYFYQKVLNCGEHKALWGGVGYSAYIPTYPCGSYAGKTGGLSASLKSIQAASDLSNIQVHFAFPGQTGFCGGYFSPLMIFFDQKKPDFTAITDFPLNKVGNSYWPEAGSNAFFLALDRNHNGIIDQGNELFGDNLQNAPNGFDVLKKLDSNKDLIFDERDKEFKNVVLWNDQNADGKSTKAELTPLHQKIQKISLKYTKGDIEYLGKNAQSREHSKIWLVGEKSWSKKIRIDDIWLQPAPTALSQK